MVGFRTSDLNSRGHGVMHQRRAGQSVVFRTDCMEFEWETECFSHWQALNS